MGVIDNIINNGRITQGKLKVKECCKIDLHCYVGPVLQL